MKTGIIYCYVNKVNGKCYVGQTIHESRRKIAHIQDAFKYNKQTPFHRAIRKYGVDTFEYIVLDTVNVNVLNEKETYWISKLDSYKKGYNATEIGGSNRGFKRSKESNMKSSISISKPIYQLNKNNTITSEFTSVKHAAVSLGDIKFAGHISKVCNNKRKSAYGYKWMFKNKTNNLINNNKTF